MNNTDTIFALSSVPGKSGVALIRISGANLMDMARAIMGRDCVKPRHAYFTALHDGDCLIDNCIATYFAGPNSFTGEDVIELSTHGSMAVVRRTFDYLVARFGARMATPGEFSRRAFNNGKMDLADVDALAALLDAQTERQRIQALHAITGDGAQYAAWRHDMIEISAYAAAILDYNADDLPANIGDIISGRIRKLCTDIDDAISRYAAVRAVRSGFNIALIGPTNAGKSSLFNRILGQNRAIVSDIPGTTRDVVTACIDIDGYMVNIADTAGLRTTDNTIEQIGIEKTNEEILSADLILNLGSEKYRDNEIRVINKSDMITTHDNADAIYVSAKTGDGMSELMTAIRDRMGDILSRAEGALAVNERTRGLLMNASENLKRATELKDNYDLVAEHVRMAADAIGKILGVITVQEVMDATFSQLCLGK